MNILIIGNKGFIGSHIQYYFSQLPGAEVWGCDVVTDYAAKNYFLIDATNADYGQVFETQSFDVCINCSGAASVPDSMRNPARDYHLNTFNVLHLLESIRTHCMDCRFLNLSSAAVYGNPDTLPVSESSEVYPLSPYGWHKYQSELICKEYFEIYGLKTCSARIFSAFGPGLQKQLFWDWYQRTLANDHLVLFGTGEESRDFIFIEDLVQAIHCIVAQSSFQGNSVNVANGTQVYIKDAIEVFRKQLGRTFTYEFNNEVRKGDPLNWQAEIGQLQSLGYAPRTSFEEGMKKYIGWLQQKR